MTRSRAWRRPGRRSWSSCPAAPAPASPRSCASCCGRSPGAAASTWRPSSSSSSAGIPYLTFAQAFGELARDLLVESAEQIAAWRRRLAAAVGPHGALVLELVPDLGLILGPQPVAPALPPHEAEARLRQVLRRLIGAFAAAEHPLALFLDDLQWADAASLALLDELLTAADTRHVLVIGAYRDAEVGADHPLARAIERLPARGARSQRSSSRRCRGRARAAVAGTLHATAAEAAPLARLVREKTAGNPFFAIQLLSALHREGAIWFERDARSAGAGTPSGSAPRATPTTSSS